LLQAHLSYCDTEHDVTFQVFRFNCQHGWLLVG